MDRKIIDFLIITVLFLILYQYFVSRHYPTASPPPVPQEAPQQEPSIVQSPQEEQDIPHPSQEIASPSFLPQASTEELVEAESDEFIITISKTGGYIKKIYSKRYQEDLAFTNIGFTPLFKDTPFTLKTPTANTIILENSQKNIRKTWEFNGFAATFRLQLPERDTVTLFFSFWGF